MRRLFLLSLFLSSCAPLVCPEGEDVKRNYLEYEAPSSYTADLSLRYGLFSVPIRVEKSEGKFIISGEGRTGEWSINRFCMKGMCVELPISPDGVIFGRVLRGDENLSCSSSGVFFEKDDGVFKSKYVFKDGSLALAEFHDTKRNRKLILSYLEWSKEGYARAIRVQTEGLSLTLTVDSLKF